MSNNLRPRKRWYVIVC